MRLATLFLFAACISGFAQARQIIILKGTTSPSISFQVAFWIPTPAARQSFACIGSAPTSQVQATTNVGADGGATTAEIAAIANCSVTEIVKSENWPGGTAIGTIQAALQAEWAVLNTQLTGPTANFWVYYLTSWNGTAWTVKQVN